MRNILQQDQHRRDQYVQPRIIPEAIKYTLFCVIPTCKMHNSPVNSIQ